MVNGYENELNEYYMNFSDEMLLEWQNIVDLVARISGAQVGLIMRLHGDDIEVLVSNKNTSNPYNVGDREKLYGSGLYCERVVETREKLLVTNALKYQEWSHNPDLKHNIIAYLGFPILLPDGQVFGTLCLLDDKEMRPSEDLNELMEKMVSLVEGQLKLKNLILQNAAKANEIENKANLLKSTHDELEGFFNVALDLLCIADTDGNFIRVNSSWSDILGYPLEELEKRTFLEFVHPDDLVATLEAMSELGQQKDVLNFTNRYLAKDGTYKYIEWRSRPKDKLIFAGARDITDQKKQEDALKKSEEMYRLITETISDVIWVLNSTTLKFVYISPSIMQLRGYTVEEAMAQSIEEAIIPESLKIFLDHNKLHMEEFINNPEKPRMFINEIQQPCKNGDIIWVETSSRYRYNSVNEIEIVGSSRDINDRKKAQHEILYLSYHDHLTGLFNRRFYEEELSRLDTERNYPITLIIADLNNLKRTNDTYGHVMGDELLKGFADILKKEFRKDDIIARIGGDEFVILLPKTDYTTAEGITSRISEKMASGELGNTLLSAAFGCRTKYCKVDSFDSIFKSAEDIMYDNKKKQRNNFRTSGSIST